MMRNDFGNLLTHHFSIDLVNNSFANKQNDAKADRKSCFASKTCFESVRWCPFVQKWCEKEFCCSLRIKISVHTHRSRYAWSKMMRNKAIPLCLASFVSSFILFLFEDRVHGSSTTKLPAKASSLINHGRPAGLDTHLLRESEETRQAQRQEGRKNLRNASPWFFRAMVWQEQT